MTCPTNDGEVRHLFFLGSETCLCGQKKMEVQIVTRDVNEVVQIPEDIGSPEERAMWLLQNDPKVLERAAENMFVHYYKGSQQMARADWQTRSEDDKMLWKSRVLKEQQKLIDMSPAEREMARRGDRKEMLDRNERG